jgi:RNA polymerase sigma-70 factor (ECF subfamily)
VRSPKGSAGAGVVIGGGAYQRKPGKSSPRCIGPHPAPDDATLAPMPDPLPSPALLAVAFGAAEHGRSLALGERLRDLLLAAQALHPGIRLDPERFVRHLAHHRPAGPLPEGWLDSLCAGDLYLACACAEGVPAAVEALDRLYRAQVGAHLSGMRPTPAFVEDVAQAVLERLLVGVDGSPPRIAEYSGRGAIGSFLRVVTVRLALDVRRRRTEELSEEAQEREATPGEDARVDAEIDLLKRQYAGEFNEAFRAAVGALSGEQRGLLRAHFVEGTTLDQLAAARGVHRATVARWIAAARQEILAGARRQLGERLRVRPAELESLMGLMKSRLDLSLSGSFPEG